MADDALARCMFCGEPFIKKRHDQIHCNRRCNWRAQAIRRSAERPGGQPPAIVPCDQCGTFFRQKYRHHLRCSQPCIEKADIARKRRAYARNRPASVPAQDKACAGCGATFSPIFLGQLYCDQRCHTRVRRKKNCEREKRKRRAARAALRAAQPVQVSLPPRPRGVCIFCGSSFEPRRWNSVVCSDACRSLLETTNKSHRKKARLLGLPYEPINPLLVFERDGWKCQMCGRATPRRLRGTKDPRAPELDHRIPMTLGGGHVWANVQCACAFCNQSKGGRRVLGQLSLLGPPAS